MYRTVFKKIWKKKTHNSFLNCILTLNASPDFNVPNMKKMGMLQYTDVNLSPDTEASLPNWTYPPAPSQQLG